MSYNSKENKIPYNDKEYFNICKSSSWKYSIDVEIYKNKNINLYNLYMILKKYINCKIIPLYEIMAIIKRSEKEIVTICIRTIDIKWRDYIDFKKWYDHEIREIWKYEDENSENPIAFRLLFNKKIVKEYNKINNGEDILDYYKPIYDWEDWEDINISNELKNIIEDIDKSEKIDKNIIIKKLNILLKKIK